MLSRYPANACASGQKPFRAVPASQVVWPLLLFLLAALATPDAALARRQAREVSLPPEMEAKANAVCGKIDVFDCYANHKYGYLIAWPKNLLVAQGESDAGDGQVFNAPDDRARLTCWAGFNNVLKQPLEKEFQEAQQEPGLQVTYKTLGKDFFVVSGIKDGNIIYRKTVMTEMVQATFVLTYDQALKNEFNPLVGDIAKSFIAHAAFQ